MFRTFLILSIILGPFILNAQTTRQLANAKKEEAELSNKIIPPLPVRAAFAKDFPSEKITSWQKEKGHFEGNYVQNGQKKSVTYNSNGQRIESETIIAASQMPAGVMDYVAKHYKGYKIKETAVIKKSNGQEIYEVEVNGLDLHFTKEGKFINAIKE